MAPQNAKHGTYSSEFKQWIKAADLDALAAFVTLPPEQARAAVKMGEDSVTDGFTSVIYEDHPIIAPGVTARVFKQKNPSSATSSKPRPLLLIYHGGGWSVGGHTTESVITRTLVGKLGFVGVSIDYRLTPEHPFPTPFNDCYDGLLWAIKNAASFGADPDCVFVAGSSAGGNLSAAVALKARDEGLSNVKAQILIIPVTCHYKLLPKDKYELNSYEELSNVPVLSAENMKAFWDKYDPQGQQNPYISPLIASSHAGLPPAYIQVAGSDVLRDEALAYARALESSGVKVRLEVYPGLPHGFCAPQLGFATSAKAESALEENEKWLLKYVGGKSSL